MASRPSLHPVLEQWPAGYPASLKRIDKMGDWLHFVGTGWIFALRS
jgi:hypothetical protein